MRRLSRWTARSGAAGLAAACALLALTSSVPFARGASEHTDPTPASSSTTPEPPQPLPGQLSSRFKLDKADPEASVPSPKERDSNPLEYGYFIQDLLTEAEQANKRHDYKAVALYYRAVAKAVPDNAKGWSKLCEAYEVLNDRERAIRACKYALERPAVVLDDYVRYVRLHLGKTTDLTAEESRAVNEVLIHLDKQPEIAATAAQLKCEVGVKTKDTRLLEACTRTLAKVAPADARTIVFQWNLALQKGERGNAQRLIQQAKKAGVVLPHVERMEKVTESSGRLLSGRALSLVAVALLGLAALLVWQIRRRPRHRHSP